MSYSVDANLLLYASDTSSPWHDKAAQFLANCAGEPEIFYLAWPTVMAYLRISTHPAIFAAPLAPREAEGNIEALLALPQVRLVAEEEGFWATYRGVTGDLAIRGNLVPDAHLAALLLHHGVKRLFTRDRDFRKFEFLEARDPFL